MKSVLISIKPKWCEKIASGEKTIEVRRSAPIRNLPFKVYIYCTKGKQVKHCVTYYASGKVIGEFICRGIMQPLSSLHLMAKESCLTEEELANYSNGKQLYGWHISDLKIYDKPKNLSEFFKLCPTRENGDCLSCDCLADNDYGGVCTNNLTRPPQSYMWVEEL